MLCSKNWRSSQTASAKKFNRLLFCNIPTTCLFSLANSILLLRDVFHRGIQLLHPFLNIITHRILKDPFMRGVTFLFDFVFRIVCEFQLKFYSERFLSCYKSGFCTSREKADFAE